MSLPPFVSIYESRRRRDTYLFVYQRDGMTRVPEALKALFEGARHVTDLLLKPEKKLARGTGAEVLSALDRDGFHLQLPPPPEPWLLKPDEAPAWRHRSRQETPDHDG